jgi:hypothetical protein
LDRGLSLYAYTGHADIVTASFSTPLRFRSRRSKSRAHDSHPVDLAVALAEVDLLLDHERSIRSMAPESVRDPLAICKRVRVEADHLFDFAIAEPPL